MFRSPSDPNPFSSTRCPYVFQARCGRPYCPFAHQADDTVDVVEGCLGYVSKTNPTTTTTNDGQHPYRRKLRSHADIEVDEEEDEKENRGPDGRKRKVPKVPHRCAKCPKKFVKFSGLQRHYLTHTDLKEFKCRLCPYESNQKEHLERHMSIHRYGEKCRFCGAPIVPQWFKHHEKTCTTADQFSKILEKINELEKEQKQRKALLNFRQNYWDANVCHENLEIIANKSLIVHHKGTNSGYCSSVFAKHPILQDNKSSDIFYYEIAIGNEENWMSFGFAVKQQNKLDGTIRSRKGTYAIDSDGKIWINGEGKGINDEYCYGEGDTIGIGVNLATRHIIFTKNGHRLDSYGLLVASSFGDDSFHPFVSLHDSGDKIEANFGANFKFALEAL
ncbi:hypothetical protein niasHT_002368 [Heterodera trifolii]|uniref:B30.2/SPRY domain-containing protein n=1 Tax=Heterodera trifolii TaxID=157864 RepID=A0ABD2LM21_9BILA